LAKSYNTEMKSRITILRTSPQILLAIIWVLTCLLTNTSAQTVTVTAKSDVDTAPLNSDAINQRLLNFSISSTEETNLTSLTIHATKPIAGRFDNFRLYGSSTASFGDATLLGSGTVSSQTILFSFSFELTTSEQFIFVVADVDPQTNQATDAIGFSFDEEDITVDDGNINEVEVVSLAYDFIDTIKPSIVSQSPTPNQTNISLSLNQITFTFQEPIVVVGDNSTLNKTIYLININTSTLNTIPLADITVSNEVVSLSLSTNLDAASTYTVVVGNEMIQDVYGNPFDGIAIENWKFTTVDNSPVVTSMDTELCKGETITINGNYFGSSPTVTFNGTNVTLLTSSTTSITFQIPTSAASGIADIVIINPENSLQVLVNTIIKNVLTANLTPYSDPNQPTLGSAYQIKLNSTQSHAQYKIREIPNAFESPVPGGSTLSFGPYTKNAAGTYTYEIMASSSGCQDVTYTHQIVFQALTAHPGSNKSICEGGSTVIGGTPAATGGSGFYQLSWTGPNGFTSSLSNPTVTTAGTYILTVKDHLGIEKNASMVVTEIPKPTFNFVEIPATYYTNQSPTKLVAQVTPAGGTGMFQGLGVVKHGDGEYYFHPSIAQPGNGILITYFYTSSEGCQFYEEIPVDVLLESPINNLKTNYCIYEGTSEISINENTIPHHNSNEIVFANSNGDEINSSDPNYPLTLIPNTTPKRYVFNPEKAYNLLHATNQYDFQFVVKGNRVLGVGGIGITVPVKFALVPSKINPFTIKPTILGITEGFSICNNTSAITLTASTDNNNYLTESYQVHDFATNNIAPSLISNQSGTYQFLTQQVTFAQNEAYRQYKIIYNYKDNLGCAGRVETNPFNVVKKPALPIAENQQYCQFFEGAVTLTASGQFNDLSWYTDASLSDPNPGKGTIYNTHVSTSTSKSQKFYVTDNFGGCSSDAKEVTLDITPVPNLNLDIDSQCLDKPGLFQGPSDANIIEYEWNMGDGTTASTKNVTHTFTRVDEYRVSLKVYYDNNGQVCYAADTVRVNVGDNPTPNFTYAHVCAGDVTLFEGSSDITVQQFAWNFGDGDVVAAGLTNATVNQHNGRTGGTYQKPTHAFNSNGDAFTVSMTAYTSLGCHTTIQKTLNILPYLQHSTTTPYLMSQVDNEKGFWSVEDQKGNSTWEFNKPTTPILGSEDFAWVTNANGLYASNDLSYVNSPCLDISNIVSPVISLDYKINTQRAADGAALQYSEDGVTWFTLGATQSGKFWFNEVGIPLGGNNQAWSGELINETEDWFEAKHRLDVINNKQKVRFRIAFYSGQETELEGFAFKDVRIESRNRKMLVENFTNEGAPQSALNNTEFYNLTATDLVKLEYHTSFPTESTMNRQGQVDQNARTAFYGITNNTNMIPRVFLDGYSNGNLIPGQNSWYLSEVLYRGLESSPFQLVIETEPTSEGSIHINTHVTALRETNNHAMLHIVLVEKNVNTNKFVVRKFLPHAAGTRIMSSIIEQPNATQTFSQQWNVTNIDNLEELAIVAFIQDEITKEVYQAEFKEFPEHLPTIITGVEKMQETFLKLYPNPVTTPHVMLEFKSPLTHDVQVSIIDNKGITAQSLALPKGKSRYELNVQDLTSGIYILRIQHETGFWNTKFVLTTD
jgi:hypothetical protein